MHVAFESPEQSDVAGLIAELDAYQDTLYPPESRYALDLASVVPASLLFAVARSSDGSAMGCAGIVVHGEWGELKRMYVKPVHRGQGTAALLVEHLERQAAILGCTTIRLETGPDQPDALRFYARNGYLRRGPFAGYPDDPLSVFMEKSPGLSVASGF
jgi:putative acetyltransferase